MMTTHTTHESPELDRRAAGEVFADPVAYLGSFGIDSKLMVAERLPAAA